jgi:hypothetical protein
MLQALLSVYSDERTVCFSVSEAACLKAAREVLEEAQSTGSAVNTYSLCEFPRLSGCIHIPDVQVEESAVTIKFVLPVEYPDVRPSLQLIANAPRCSLVHAIPAHAATC